MSLIKLLKAPSLLFKKDVITFLIIRRQDLDVLGESLRYIAVKPTASISVLRQKIWHLLDLPDYCDEIIKLRTQDGKDLPLTELRKGNDPQHPYILEVWPPPKGSSSTTFHHMITMGDSTILDRNSNSCSELQEKEHNEGSAKSLVPGQRTLSSKTVEVNKLQDIMDIPPNLLHSDYKPSEMSCKISTSSIFYKLQTRKSRDNFTNILMKIQNDLNVLSTKLSILENKIQL